MNKHNLITSAYEKYADVQLIIDIITDDGYLSVTELASLLCKLLCTNSIKPKIINKLLIDNGYIIKRDKEAIKIERNLGLQPSKYLPTKSASPYCKKRCFNELSFYLWKFDIFLILFNLDFRQEITIDSIKHLRSILSKYVNIKFDNEEILLNAIMLQIILKKESYKFKLYG